jgi:hypothetical protein
VVRDHDGQRGFAADLQRFADGLDDLIALAAHMGGVDRARVTRGHARQGHYFGGWRRAACRIAEAGAHAQAAIAQRLIEHRGHRLDFLGGGGTRGIGHCAARSVL